MRYVARLGPVGVLVSTLLFLTPGSAAEATAPVGFLVFCDPASGEVSVDSKLNRDHRIAMSEVLPGMVTAGIWIEDNCPSGRCDANGRCVTQAPGIDSDGWYVLCNQSSGDVALVHGALPPGFSLMAGPQSSKQEAESWVTDSCPGWRCEPSGACSGPTSHPMGESRPETPSRSSNANGALSHNRSLSATTGKGVSVVSVLEGSSAEAGGLVVGDILLRVNGVAASSPQQVVRQLAAVRPGTWLDFDVERKGQQLSLGTLRTVNQLGLFVGRRTPPADNVSSLAPRTQTGWTVGTVKTVGGESEPRSSTRSNGGWTAGEVRTNSLSTNGATGATSMNTVKVAAPLQARVDVSRLVAAARMCVEACAYPTALANADQMAKHDPSNPWLGANHERLRRLASRQRMTEQAVWRASSQIDDGKLKAARKTVEQAADMAVACQTEAVSVLLDRIDAVIDHRKAERAAASGRAAAELLAGLVVLNQAVTARHAGAPYSAAQVGGGAAPATATVGAAAGGTGDPCAFDYSYPNKWTPEPICACNGYRFEPTQLRCVK